jgi:hypothetical protein
VNGTRRCRRSCVAPRAAAAGNAMSNRPDRADRNIRGRCVTERMQDSAATRRRVRDLANLEHPAHGLGTHVVARIELVGASRTPGSFKRPRNGRCRTIGLLVAGPSSHRAAVTGVGVKRPAILRNDPAAPRRHVSLGIDHRTLWASGWHARIWWWLSDKPTSSSTLCIRHKVTILSGTILTRRTRSGRLGRSHEIGQTVIVRFIQRVWFVRQPRRDAGAADA